MRNIITIVVLVVVGMVAYNYFQTGEFSLMPTSMSEEEQELNRLKGEFHRVAQQFRQAGRSAGLSGMDTTDAAGAALAPLEGIERDLRKLKKDSEDSEVKNKIDDLMNEIKDFKSKIR